MNSGLGIYNTELKNQIIPYYELFADLIAVVSIDDPRAIAKEIDYNASNGLSDSVESLNMNLIDQIDKTAQEF